ncbi:MAG TPA: A/G-specific adenine glycosylase [Stellaceae bacterium]|nr:A/G-specific adenine glycosylase [Stellaceae bacterium]
MSPIAAEAVLDTDTIAPKLLRWYDRHRRILPWRAKPGETPDAYRVWLSEIMLQQTTVATVGAYFDRFVARFPTVEALANASLDDVLHAWQGLGYYARARNLHACARAVMAEHGGRFPGTVEGLRALPGIGAYTAAAIAAIAFDRKAAAVDGNVERVVARLFAVEAPLPAAKAELRHLTGTLVPDRRAGDFAQALMDLGAAVCTPRAPRCILCPIGDSCRGRGLGLAETLPRRRAKAARPTRRGIAFWAVRPDGSVLLRRRPEQGLLGGMVEVPSTEWQEKAISESAARKEAPVRASWVRLPGTVRHAFTHFNLELAVLAGETDAKTKTSAGDWVPLDRLSEQALPTVMKKVVNHALGVARRSRR